LRYRTAAIVSILLICAIFGLRSAGGPLARWYLERGAVEVPLYARIFLSLAIFCVRFWWFLVPAMISVPLTIAILSEPRPRR